MWNGIVTTMFSGNRRYLALWLPFLPTDRLHRQRRRRSSLGAGPADLPLVVLRRVNNALCLAHVDQRGLDHGLMPGLTLADARIRMPSLITVDDDPAADRVLLDHLADWCDRYTPLVGLDGPDGLMLDITGCAHLFGGEQVLRDDMTRRIAAMGFTLRSAIAGTPDAARALARFSEGGICPPGAEAHAVRPLPVRALGLEEETILALQRTGLVTIADLADRPRKPLVARFGRDLVERLQRVLGEVDHPISPRRPVPVLMAERRFPEPLVRRDDLLATLTALGEELALLLERSGLGARHFEAGFFRADGQTRYIDVVTARPLRDADALGCLLSERLAGLADPLDIGFGFDVIRLSVRAVEALAPAQIGFDRRGGEDEAVLALVERLAARFGTARILGFTPGDSYLPEQAARLEPFLPQAAGSSAAWPEALAGEPPLQPLRLFDPPEPVETIAEVPDGPPKRFRWRRVVHEVAAAEGPARISAEWWRTAPGTEQDALTRDYFRVEDRDGRRFWLYRDGLYARETDRPRWYLHGLFA